MLVKTGMQRVLLLKTVLAERDGLSGTKFDGAVYGTESGSLRAATRLATRVPDGRAKGNEGEPKRETSQIECASTRPSTKLAV